MAQTTIVIRKYENRRLYDTTNSRYVNLDEVAQLLQQGNEVQVIDASSGEDITRLILTQIIVEDAKLPESNFPLDLLRQMVIASGRASQESALQYMKMMLGMYQNAYRVMPDFLSPFDMMKDARGSNAKGTEAGKRSSAPEGPADARPQERETEPGEVADLKARLAELEKLVSKITPPKANGNRKTR